MARIFLASYDDIDQWGRRSDAVLKTIEKTDVIFLMKNNKELNTSKTNMITNMKKACNVKIADGEHGNLAVSGKQLLKDYLEKENEKHNVYIIGPSMQCIYNDRKDLIPLAEEIFYHHCFQVKKLKPQKESVDNGQMDMLELLQGTDVKYENNLSEKTENLSSAKPFERRQQNREVKKTQPGGGNRGSKQNYFSDSEKSKESIEKQVFGTNIPQQKYHEPHNSMQNAKSHLVYELLKRIRSHIKKLLFSQKETIVLTDKQLMTFILIILKVNSPEDFNESWSSTETDPKIVLKHGVFEQIKGEITYYNKVVDLIYGEDEWEV